MPVAARGDITGWLLCFFSLSMLLINHWATTLPYQWLPMVVILLFLAPWAWVFIRQPIAAVRHVLAGWPLLALPVLALASTIWSDYPAWSARAGTQFLITTIVGILAATCIRPRSLLSALLCALSLIALLSVFSGGSQGLGLSGEVVLAGLFGSKNYFGLCVSLLLLTAIIVALDRRQSRFFRLLGTTAALFSPLLLIQTKSTGAIVVVLVTSIITSVLYFSLRLSPLARSAIIAVTIIILVMFIALGTLNLDAIQDILAYFGKDVTLTGRTFLWGHALTSLAENPVLGVGYQAYWQVGNWAAEQLWQYAGISNKYGFHFHNTYLQVLVDLGAVGLITLLATFIVITARAALVVVSARPSLEQLFAIAVFIFLLLRTPIEVDLFFQFQIPTILFCMIWLYLRSPTPSQFMIRDVQLGRLSP